MDWIKWEENTEENTIQILLRNETKETIYWSAENFESQDVIHQEDNEVDEFGDVDEGNAPI
jgi:hypothetical protein